MNKQSDVNTLRWLMILLVALSVLFYTPGMVQAGPGTASVNLTLVKGWNALAASMTGGNGVTSIAKIGTDVYIAGDFTAVGECTTGCLGLAKWDGTTWSSVGGGPSFAGVWTLTVNNGILYAGGIFTSMGSCTTGCNRIAQWDGIVWSPVGAGVNGTVNAIAFVGSDLYATGSFTTATNDAGHGGAAVSSSGIAKFSGGAWSSISSDWTSPWGVLGNALLVDGTNLYVGGAIATVDGVTVKNVAKYDTLTDTWSAVGQAGAAAGAQLVYTLAFDPSNTLYAAGSIGFTNANSESVQSVAKWDGTNWRPLAIGAPYVGTVYDIAFDGTDLYIGGLISSITGCTGCKSIAKWNGTAYEAVGGGVGTADISPSVKALLIDNGQIYTGGKFTTAGGVATINTAIYQPPFPAVITFDTAPTPTYLGSNFTVSASTTNTDSTALTYSAVSGPCALVSGATFSSSGAGDCVVKASGAVSANFGAIEKTQTVTIAKAAPTVTFDTAPTPTYLGGNFTASANTTNTDSNSLTYTKVSGPCALVSGATFSSSGAGDCVVKASGAVSTNFAAAEQTQTITIAKANPTVTFDAAPTPTYLGGNFTVSASTTNTDSNTLTYTKVSGPCAWVSGATFSSSGAGDCVVKASGAVSTNFAAAEQTQTVTIAKAAATVTFGAAPTPAYLGGNFTVSASTTNTDSSSLTYTKVSGPCAWVSGATFSSSGAGDCVVKASGAVSTNFSATEKNQTVTIAIATSIVTFGTAPTPTYLGGNFTVSASTTNTDSNSLTYTKVSGPCALVSGATFSSSGPGNCVVKASGAVSTNFAAAEQTQTVTIAKAIATVTFGAAPTPTYLGGDFTVSASTTNTDSNSLTYTKVSGPCALVIGATFSSSGAGDCVVKANGAASTNFAAVEQTQTVTIAKVAVTVTFGIAPTPTYLGGDFTVSADTSNTDSTALIYSAVSGPCALVNGATFSSSGAGDCVVKASGATSANFAAAEQIQTITIAKATPAITFDPLLEVSFPGPNFTIHANSTNTDNPALIFELISGPCEYVSGSTFKPTALGECVIRASSLATANFEATYTDLHVNVRIVYYMPIISR